MLFKKELPFPQFIILPQISYHCSTYLHNTTCTTEGKHGIQRKITQKGSKTKRLKKKVWEVSPTDNYTQGSKEIKWFRKRKWPRQKYKNWFPLNCLYFYHPTSQLVVKLEVGLGWVKGLRQAKCPKNYTNNFV